MLLEDADIVTDAPLDIGTAPNLEAPLAGAAVAKPTCFWPIALILDGAARPILLAAGAMVKS